ncbi:MAG: MaoC/PaaZ C-terminal domain-containing protein [Steroidobacteraceae bacterium]
MSASSRSPSEDLRREPRRFDEVAVGQRLPDLPFAISGADIIRFAGAVDDYAEPHWDHVFMVERGMPGIIVHGGFTFSVMCRVVEQWFPPEVADYRDCSVRYLRPSLPGEGRYGARIASREELSGERRIGIDLWAENAAGARLAEGTMTVVLVADPPRP